MRIPAFIASLFFAFNSYAAVMGYDDAKLLLNRTGFSATEKEIAELAPLTRERAVERILQGTKTAAQTSPPDWVNSFTRPRKKEMSEEERKAFQKEEYEKSIDLRGWWLTEMLNTPSPLTEKMTLFWHNHFVSSQQKVKFPELMYRQNVLLRKYAVGNFAEFLHAIAKDPAMIIYLDSATNRKGQPNENFAREVMELFTLGEGHYSERDIKEAARAYTGWSVEPETGEYRWRPNIHDNDNKIVLGRSGNFDGDAVLDILLAQPATAEFIVGKLWREFISPEPDAKEIQRIANNFRNNGYDIKTALRGLLLSPAFYAKENRGALVKSPVDLVVGTFREFDVSISDPLPVIFAVRQLGQDLFAPPNVKGWPGGESWINSNTLLARKQFLEKLFRAQEMPRGKGGMMTQMGNVFSPAKGINRLLDGKQRLAQATADIHFNGDKWMAQFVYGDKQQAAIEHALLPIAPETPPAANIRGIDFIRQVVLDPVYQLK